MFDDHLGERAVPAADVQPSQTRRRHEPGEELIADKPAPRAHVALVRPAIVESDCLVIHCGFIRIYPSRSSTAYALETMYIHRMRTGAVLFTFAFTVMVHAQDNTWAMCDAVAHPRVGVLFDTLHANIEEKGIADAIRTAAPYTVHVHISENDRSTPGTGGISWGPTFDALKQVGYQSWLVVEAFGLALPALFAATKIWRRMFDSEEQLARDAIAFMRREVAKRW